MPNIALYKSEIQRRYEKGLDFENSITNKCVYPDRKLCKRRLSLFLPILLTPVGNWSL